MPTVLGQSGIGKGQPNEIVGLEDMTIYDGQI